MSLLYVIRAGKRHTCIIQTEFTAHRKELSIKASATSKDNIQVPGNTRLHVLFFFKGFFLYTYLVFETRLLEVDIGLPSWQVTAKMYDPRRESCGLENEGLHVKRMRHKLYIRNQYQLK